MARALAFAAEEAEAALIVLGGTHRCGPGRVVPGATAEAVIQAAPCPVAVAPAGYAQRADRRSFGLIAAAVDAGADTSGSPEWRPGSLRAPARRCRSLRAALLAREDAFSGAVLVAKDGRMRFSRVYGPADRNRGVPNTARTRFGSGR